MKIPPVGSELFHANRWTDRHDGTSSRFSQIKTLLTRYRHPTAKFYSIDNKVKTALVLQFFKHMLKLRPDDYLKKKTNTAP
jgi:hypothetical protein